MWIVIPIVIHSYPDSFFIDVIFVSRNL